MESLVTARAVRGGGGKNNRSQRWERARGLEGSDGWVGINLSCAECAELMSQEDRITPHSSLRRGLEEGKEKGDGTEAREEGSSLNPLLVGPSAR